MHGSESLVIIPYIEQHETQDSRKEFVVGFKIGTETKYEIVIGSYMVKRNSPDAELNYGMKLFGRNTDSEIEISGIELQIYDHRQIVIYHWVHEKIGKLKNFDFNDAAEWAHTRVSVFPISLKNVKFFEKMYF